MELKEQVDWVFEDLACEHDRYFEKLNIFRESVDFQQLHLKFDTNIREFRV